MPHPAATIVIPVWNQWDLTRACLESLRPTLGMRDKVVVVDNGSADGTAAGLRGFSWLKVVTNSENRGFAVACNQGAAEAGGDIVVFLNNDTLVTRHWLDGLLAPFDDPEVAATGPRSNFVSGPQLVEAADYDITEPGALRDFARGWAEQHRGQTTDVPRLVGFCLAVRREVFTEVGGFDEQFGVGGYEDDDLCNRIVEAGHRLVIAHETFVHHHGHKSFEGGGLDWYAIQQANETRLTAKRKRTSAERGPLVSACLIVKDEERDLPACLDSLAGVADEIVVYDTGSTDATRSIAEAAGAKVIEGFWDDDFSRARNMALAACTGQWILHVDADEVLVVEPAGLRAQLHRRTTPDALLVPIDNLLRTGSTATYTHTGARLFRRERGHWEGRLHERVLARPGQPPLTAGPVEGLRITHSGYLDETIAQRDKIQRNLRMAEAVIAAGDEDTASAHLNLARALVTADRLDDALPHFETAAGTDSVGPATRRAALRGAAEALLVADRGAEALDWIDRFRNASTRPDVADLLAAQARILMGEPETALDLLDELGELVADDGYKPAMGALPIARAKALADAGRPGEAADELLGLVRSAGPVHGVIGQLDRMLDLAGRSLAELAGVLAADGVTTALAELLSLPPEHGDELLETMWARSQNEPHLLAAAIRLAPHMSVGRALEWSARIRQAGLADECPLLAMAADPGRRADERVRAGAMAATAFADERGTDAVEMAAPSVLSGHLGGLLRELVALAPDTLDAFIVGAAVDARRSLALARTMHELGGAEEARAVLEHGLSRPGTDAAVTEQAAAWLEAIGQDERAGQLRSGAAPR
jgi:GT2 family glycosyltransferase